MTCFIADRPNLSPLSSKPTLLYAKHNQVLVLRPITFLLRIWKFWFVFLLMQNLLLSSCDRRPLSPIPGVYCWRWCNLNSKKLWGKKGRKQKYKTPGDIDEVITALVAAIYFHRFKSASLVHGHYVGNAGIGFSGSRSFVCYSSQTAIPWRVVALVRALGES